MKKTYSTPSQKVVDLELESLIADSPLGTNNNRGNGVQLTKGEQDWDDAWDESTTIEGVWQEW